MNEPYSEGVIRRARTLHAPLVDRSIHQDAILNKVGSSDVLSIMKHVILGMKLVFCVSLCQGQTVTIPAGYNMLLTGGGPGQDGLPAPQGTDVALEATLTNLRKDIDVKVWSASGEPLRGFGLGRRGIATVYVRPGERLLVSTGEGRDGKVKVEYELAPSTQVTEGKTIAFVLSNPTLCSIPLEIPGVMNPNLSPKSESGVALRPGQPIYWTPSKRSRTLIYRVPEDLLPGTVLDVSDLLELVKSTKPIYD